MHEVEHPIEWYERNWRRLEVANGRSGVSGHKWKGLQHEKGERPPTPEEWAFLARYTRLRNAGVDHRTAVEQIKGRDPGPDTDRRVERFLAEGILVVGGRGIQE